MKVAVVNLKGGVAKTTTAYFLATALSGRGRTLLVDCDPQGSAMEWSEVAVADADGELPFNVVGMATKDANRKVRGMEGDYEYIVLDTPPGEIAIARSALMAADLALVAMPPASMDVNRLRPTLELIAEVEPLNDLTYYVLLTRVRRISRESRDAREVLEDLELPVLDTEIPLLGYYADCFGAQVEDLGEYADLAAEILGEPVEGQEVKG